MSINAKIEFDHSGCIYSKSTVVLMSNFEPAMLEGMNCQYLVFDKVVAKTLRKFA